MFKHQATVLDPTWFLVSYTAFYIKKGDGRVKKTSSVQGWREQDRL